MTERSTINGGVIAMENYGTIGRPQDDDRVNILERDARYYCIGVHSLLTSQ